MRHFKSKYQILEKYHMNHVNQKTQSISQLQNNTKIKQTSKDMEDNSNQQSKSIISFTQKDHKTLSVQPQTELDFVWESIASFAPEQKSNFEEFQKLMMIDQVDFALGSMFGAFIGDALGSYCQFRSGPFKQNDPQLDTVMEMKGNGTFKVKPGQFTDDSEMAAHLLDALCSFQPDKQFQLQQTSILMKIAEGYVQWLRSDPFDIGHTTRKALKIIKHEMYEIKCDRQDGEEIDEAKRLQKVWKQIRHENKKSSSNGSLMRITPMAFFVSLLQLDVDLDLSWQSFPNFIRNEINMTHGHEEIFASSTSWVQLLVRIISRRKDNKSLKEIYQDFIQEYEHNENIGEWIKKSKSKHILDATIDEGWAQIAYTYGIKALEQLAQLNQEQISAENFVKILKSIIQRAGDTDTNACIVGGLVGAVIGFRKLPVKYLQKQFALELDKQDQKSSWRPSFYQPRRQLLKALQLAKKLVFQQK